MIFVFLVILLWKYQKLRNKFFLTFFQIKI